jgi:glycosyltransferase involved in cell wall biosynthesis
MDLGELTLLEKNKTSINVLYIFGFKYSLHTWVDSGSLDRETLFFNAVNEKAEINYYLLTYGTSQDLNLIKFPNIKIIPMFSKYKFDSKFVIFIYSLFYPIFFYKRFKNIDVIKVNQLSGSWVGMLLKLILKKPLYIRTGYDAFLFSKFDRKPIYKQLMFKLLTKFALDVADLYSVTSQSDLNYVLNTYKFDKSKLILRPNWVTIPEKKSNYPLKNRLSKLISIGRLEEQKNYFLLIEALKNTDIELNIIGNGSLKNELEEFAERNKVQLKILGKLSNFETLNLLQKYKFFILPSIYEGNPKSLLEAMARGCVVFASKIENHTEIINHNINGYLFELDSGKLNKLLIDKIKNTKENELELIVSESVKSAANKFSLNKLVMSEIKDINNLLSKNSKK